MPSIQANETGHRQNAANASNSQLLIASNCVYHCKSFLGSFWSVGCCRVKSCAAETEVRKMAVTTSQATGRYAAGEATASGRARNAREAIQARQPIGAFAARAIRELTQAAPTDPARLRRTIRRSELRQVVPLADSTIYELERRGEFPLRFFLTARCVVWDLSEVETWLRSRRQPGEADLEKKAPVPDYRKWRSQIEMGNL